MALTVNQIISARAPQFAGDSRLSTFIELAQLMTSSSAFGTRYSYAVALRVCHMLALEAQRGGDGGTSTSGSGVAGTVTQEREGDLARSYGVNNTALAEYGDLGNTEYGLELIDMIRSSIFGPRTRQMEEQGSTGDD